MAAYKFRVVYEVQEAGRSESRKVEFRYRTFATARANYRAILLEFYRKRYPVPWKICLNRLRDADWEHPIFYDEGP
jgi:hypothetical protein